MSGRLKILLVGGGGREHAIAWRLARSPSVGEVHCAPGNPGIARVARIAAVAEPDVPAYAGDNDIDLVVVGPEAPLVAGLADRLRASGIKVFGHSAAAARLEGSKVFAKQFMERHGIPTAPFLVAESMSEAEKAVGNLGDDVVVKADGLAAGKGVIVCSEASAALAAARSMLVDREFGAAGGRVVIERRLEGHELSIIAITDGRGHRLLMPAQDHKQVRDGDNGPNTGGMGAYAPAHRLAPPELIVRVEREILVPVIEGMREEGNPLSGVLYAGIMIDEDGAPHVLEFNVRFGDPETQPQMLMLRSDLATLMTEADGGNVSRVEVSWHDGVAVTVVLAASGYPGTPRKGDAIRGLDTVVEDESHVIFHAGTVESDGKVVTAGGRVLGVSARDTDLEGARREAYGMVDRLRFEGMHFRSDIGSKGM